MKKLEADFLASGGAAKETEEIWRRIEQTGAFAHASTILLYMAIEGEVPTENFIRKWHGSKRIAIPKVNGESLLLYEYDPEKLQPGYKGIAEPAGDAVQIGPEEVDLALVPGVAFTRKGGRMGRGKGFYDRLLPAMDCPKIGIGFSFRWLEDLPADPWDAALTDLSGNL